MILQKVTQDEDEDFYALSQDSHWQLTNSAHQLEDNPRDLLERISSYQPQRVHCKISMQKTRDTTHWIVEDILSWVHDPSQDHDVFRRCLWISGIG
ncbi:hypothetical protein E4T50_11129 [Aureobasidium sp. EXF-12298]|nr:hypothetical protein E4T50_11129 [Aureobasidium sp. EXF-12298]KAI4765016.1 hypothetical protein E4T51_01987 [Aureobasidium sp. EXF-12344]KAI4784921.1 hypothetical protein E4T52_00188 [Aureobasidium sp. EXF-3400]